MADPKRELLLCIREIVDRLEHAPPGFFPLQIRDLVQQAEELRKAAGYEMLELPLFEFTEFKLASSPTAEAMREPAGCFHVGDPPSDSWGGSRVYLYRLGTAAPDGCLSGDPEGLQNIFVRLRLWERTIECDLRAAAVLEFDGLSHRVECWLLDWPCFLSAPESLEGNPDNDHLLLTDIVDHSHIVDRSFGDFSDEIIAVVGTAGSIVEAEWESEACSTLYGASAHQVAGLWALSVSDEINKAMADSDAQKAVELLREKRPYCDRDSNLKLSLLVKRERVLLLASGDAGMMNARCKTNGGKPQLHGDTELQQGQPTDRAETEPRRPGPLQPDRAILFHGDGCYSVTGGQPFSVTPNEDCVLQAFLKQPAYDSEALKTNAGVDRAPETLRKLREKYSELAAFISLPGGRGKGGYRVRIRRAANAPQPGPNRAE